MTLTFDLPDEHWIEACPKCSTPARHHFVSGDSSMSCRWCGYFCRETAEGERTEGYAEVEGAPS